MAASYPSTDNPSHIFAEEAPKFHCLGIMIQNKIMNIIPICISVFQLNF